MHSLAVYTSRCIGFMKQRAVVFETTAAVFVRLESHPSANKLIDKNLYGLGRMGEGEMGVPQSASDIYERR